MLRQVDEKLRCAMGEEDPYIAMERPRGELLDYEEMVQLDGGILASNTQYAVRSTQYAPKLAPDRAPIRNTQYAVRIIPQNPASHQVIRTLPKYAGHSVRSVYRTCHQ